MRLLSGPLSMFGAKAQIAALEKGIDFELVMVPFEMKRLYEPKHPDVVRINPKRQVPVLIHGDAGDFRFDADLRVFRRPQAAACLVALRHRRSARARACSSTNPTKCIFRRSSG